MFRKDRYTPAELTSLIQGVKDLEAMRDKAERNYRLIKTEHYAREYQQYTDALHAAQLVLIKVMQKAGK